MADEQPVLALGAKSKEEIALELMKFIVNSSGYGKGSGPMAGFGGKSAVKSPEEQADLFLDLFDRCRKAVAK